ncbi:MAG: type II toxin-antitoxin system VapB family antitoxin [Alphaproteobacteria bacterium]|nr:type II toxin-antitoxin system VapB family antitoxin [Alphaproteobacteria bacterium]
MRTNIEIDTDLINQVLKRTGLPSKRAAVDAALRLMLRLERQKDILALAGKVQWEGDLDESRQGRRFDKE